MQDRLIGELQRHYAAVEPWPDAAQLPLVDASGAARALLIEFPRAADWPSVGETLNFIERELDWPLPALSIGATGAYMLWLSFASHRSTVELASFWAGLRDACLADLPPERIRCHPLSGQTSVPVVPAYDAVAERWSAFIDPGMGSMFVAEAGLEFAPNPDRQAEMLAGLKPVTERDFVRGMACLQARQPSTPKPPAAVSGQYSDPADFLFAVMNDASLPLGDRIRAACALLAGGRR